MLWSYPVTPGYHHQTGSPLSSAVRRLIRPRYASLCKSSSFKNDTGVQESHVIFLFCLLNQTPHQKKRQNRNSTMMAAIPAMGPYCLRSSSQLMRTRRYLCEDWSLDSRSRWDTAEVMLLRLPVVAFADEPCCTTISYLVECERPVDPDVRHRRSNV